MRDKKEWTLMFYLASDNPLAPGVVSQLKAIKAAGFHPEANVVTQFDPYVEGTPTHIFDVNLINKLKTPGAHNVGFQGNDPFVRNLIEDKLWRDQKTRDGNLIKTVLQDILLKNHHLKYKAPVPPDDTITPQLQLRAPMDEPNPQESLKTFLSFCADKYPAHHYALFILGHGVVVGNDVFLYDEHASTHSLTLTELGVALTSFKSELERGDQFELVSFHSCSVSSLEVAFELKDTANFMLASQGPAFVGSWPYRQILIRIFNDIIRQGSNINIKRMLFKIFRFCLFNSLDFLLAGYSFQLTLCNLRRVHTIKKPIQDLVKALLDGLKDDKDNPIKDIILLAHLKSQSFYQEMYTDLYDFCFCISNKIRELKDRPCRCSTPTKPCHCIVTPQMKALDEACGKVMDKLVKENPPKKGGNSKLEQIIVAAEFIGPSYQYSRGLSVYFPWTEPVGDRRIMAEYEKYKFHTEFQKDLTPSWLTFLRAYFKNTKRPVSSAEPDSPRRHLPKPNCGDDEQKLFEDIANLICGGAPAYDSYELSGGKTSPKDPTGPDCDCPTIKNYPRDTRPRDERTEKANEKAIALSETSFNLT